MDGAAYVEGWCGLRLPMLKADAIEVSFCASHGMWRYLKRLRGTAIWERLCWRIRWSRPGRRGCAM